MIVLLRRGSHVVQKLYEQGVNDDKLLVHLTLRTDSRFNEYDPVVVRIALSALRLVDFAKVC